MPWAGVEILCGRGSAEPATHFMARKQGRDRVAPLSLPPAPGPADSDFSGSSLDLASSLEHLCGNETCKPAVPVWTIEHSPLHLRSRMRLSTYQWSRNCFHRHQMGVCFVSQPSLIN